MTRITENIDAIRRRINAAAESFGRNPAEISIIAVSKKHPAQSILDARRAGLVDFGESFFQEAAGKIQSLAGEGLRWHYIGRIQANKTRGIAEAFDWVHTVDRPKVAERLSAQRPEYAPPLKVCIQIRVGGPDRPGADPETGVKLAGIVAGLPRLEFRGLMCMPPPATDFAAQRVPFRFLREYADRLREAGLSPDSLSMGMSGDLEAAVAEGATMLRIGTALFGPRPE